MEAGIYKCMSEYLSYCSNASINLKTIRIAPLCYPNVAICMPVCFMSDFFFDCRLEEFFADKSSNTAKYRCKSPPKTVFPGLRRRTKKIWSKVEKMHCHGEPRLVRIQAQMIQQVAHGRAVLCKRTGGLRSDVARLHFNVRSATQDIFIRQQARGFLLPALREPRYQRRFGG
jgi:hypothetical protein